MALLTFSPALVAIVSVIATILTKWGVCNLGHESSPKFRDFFAIPIVSPVLSGVNTTWRFLVLDAVTILGVVWIAHCTTPSAFPIATLLFLFCLISLTIDLEHLIVPDRLTIPGILIGLASSALYPAWNDSHTWKDGLLTSAIGSAVGAGIIIAIIEFGKLAFGKHVRVLSPPEVFRFEHQADGNHIMHADDVQLFWEDMFTRKSDVLILECSNLQVRYPERTGKILTITQDTVSVDSDAPTSITPHSTIEGVATKLTIPREAMGFGDAQFMAVVGAFTSWHGAIHIILAGACLGSIIGIIMRAIGKGNVLPFVPYLSAGTLIWALFPITR